MLLIISIVWVVKTVTDTGTSRDNPNAALDALKELCQKRNLAAMAVATKLSLCVGIEL